METWNAIKARRKTTSYEDRPIEEDKLQRILDAGRRTGSSRNEQRWDFILVRDPERLKRLSQVWVGAAHVADAPAAIAVVAPVGEDPRTAESINFDLGQAVATMMIAAADLGIGTRHGSVEDYDLGAEILDLPNDQQLTWLFSLGYPSDRPLDPIERPDRRPYDDVVHLEGW